MHTKKKKNISLHDKSEQIHPHKNKCNINIWYKRTNPHRDNKRRRKILPTDLETLFCRHEKRSYSQRPHTPHVFSQRSYHILQLPLWPTASVLTPILTHQSPSHRPIAEKKPQKRTCHSSFPPIKIRCEEPRPRHCHPKLGKVPQNSSSM